MVDNLMKVDPVSDDQLQSESIQDNVDTLYFSDQDKCLTAVINLKNIVIGSNKQKEAVIELGVIPKLLQLLLDENTKPFLRYEIIATLCSLSKGTQEHVRIIVNLGTVPILIKTITDLQNNSSLVEISLRTLRSIFTSSHAPIELIYETKACGIPLSGYLLTLASTTRNWCIQECIANILAHSCRTLEHQLSLCNKGAIQTIANLLMSPACKVKIPTLQLLAQICYQNESVSTSLVSASCDGQTIPEILSDMMGQENTPLMQILAAKCMTYLFRAGAVDSQDKKIIYKTLPTLCRMCKKDKEPHIRALAADILAYLTELDTELQKTASICDQIIPTLSEYFKYKPPNNSNQKILPYQNGIYYSIIDSNSDSKDLTISQELKQSAFKAFASLGANDEDIRKKIIETDMLMDNIKKGLSDGNTKILLAALRCLHSLSRSVQQLRTTFQDHSIWIPLRELLHNASDDVLILVSSTLCNLLLEFSPSKQHFLDRNAVDLLCGLTKREQPALRLNGIWALMNMSFQTEQNVKIQILSSLGTLQIFRLLSDEDPAIVMKTLGLIRNLLSTKFHIDHIMDSYGKQLMQAVNIILDGDHRSEIKEQALCILANIADGDTAKEFIMSNEEVLKKLKTYLMNGDIRMQSASAYCISNLIWKEKEGYLERQARLKELGFKDILKQSLATPDTILFERVKTALEAFSSK